MKTRTKLIVTAAALIVVAGVGTYSMKALSQEFGPSFGPRAMHRMGAGMHGPAGMAHGMMGAGAGPHSATMAEMHVIHELLANHDRIRRSVTNLPDGIRTVTESDDPRIAQVIKEHVAGMGQRVAAGRDPGLPIESTALRAIFQNKDKIETKAETTDKGVIVVQTSSDPQTVSVLQQHAAEVTDLVQGGMQAMRTAMMRNGGMMGRMHGGPMHGVPHGGAMPGMR
jgi:hypothetical protein